MKKIVWSAALLIVAGVIIWRVASVVGEKEAQRRETVTGRIVPVEVGVLRPMRIEERVTATGTLAAASELTVCSRVAGRLVKNLVGLSDPVEAGQVVAVIDRDEVGYAFNQVEVRCNAPGKVARVLLNPGASLNPGTPLFQVVDVNRVKAVVAVREDKIRHIRSGTPASIELDAWPGASFAGRVTAVSPIANPATRAVDVEVTIPNPGHKLKPGMFVRALFLLGARRASGIPVAAVTQFEGKPVAFVVRDSLAHRTPISTGEAAGEYLEITGGLAPGDVIVLTGAQRLNHRDRVSVVRRNSDS